MNLREMGNGIAKPLIDELRRLRLESTESGLERCVHEEAHALLDIAPRKRKTHGAIKEAMVAALDTYVEWVNKYLDHPSRELTADDVLSFRCRANAWAIAQKILKARTEKGE